MKKCVWIFLFITSSSVLTRAAAQSQEIQQLLLDVEKLAQLKNILADLKKGYQIVSAGYGSIKKISQGTFDLHKAFLDRLLEVSPLVRHYRRVADILSTEIRLVGDYRRAYKQFTQSGHFSPDELDYLANVYSNLVNQSLASLETLAKVVTAGQLRMSDDERLTAIDAVWKEVDDCFTFLKHFNNETAVLALQRTKEQADVNSVKSLYRLPR